MIRYHLGSTSALVILWAMKIYKDYPSKRFLKYLDSSEGNTLLERCNSVCNWYDEVIINRKYLINQIIYNKIHDLDFNCQIVILGSGMSPLSLEIMYKYGDKVDSIFEIDQDHMEYKNQIYKTHFPEISAKIKLISSKIDKNTDLDTLLGKFKDQYDVDIPTIVLAEGISYYISKEILKKLVMDFKSSDNQNLFIFEYLVPYNEIKGQKYRDIAENIFNLIQEWCNVPEITKYSKKEVYSFFEDLNCKIIHHFNMKEMEKMRKKRNEYFGTSKPGWIEIIIARI
ncbi:class I SAM-dependent methyltransferase [Methanobacterium oryzae]|uniref:class I SAM-dependent methyltransferase n=1 Tax=Methanobacterium oryzae TaxID=69540 RepID=UPI003D1C1B15